MHPGPVNRGVELSGEVVDSPQAVITAQVEAGVVVRMAVLYELLAGSSGARQTAAGEPAEPAGRDRRRERPRTGQRARGQGRVSKPEPLVGGAGDPANLLLRDVRALDPREGLDARRDVSVRDGRIAELAEPGTLEAADGQETIDGRGRLVAMPAFFDPHVHLRTPGQEHKEDLETRHARRRRRGLSPG